jgi:hypothetical protein
MLDAGYEPTSMRAIRARYNPYVQARGRVDQLRKLGHSVDKVCTLPTAHLGAVSDCTVLAGVVLLPNECVSRMDDQARVDATHRWSSF